MSAPAYVNRVAELAKRGPADVPMADAIAILKMLADGDLVHVDAATPTKDSFELLMDRIEAAQ